MVEKADGRSDITASSTDLSNDKPYNSWPATFSAGDRYPVANLFPGMKLFEEAFEFCVDSMQRNVLFMDVLRERTQQYEEQQAKELPHVLDYGGELILDARTFDKPVNYVLGRIEPPADYIIDEKKRPFVIIDPRAGHGPGIGGFKADSEAGVAMRAGHPCYIVGFTPEPCEGQTIEDVMHVEAKFLEKVIELHPDAEGKPFIIGNCQAGWAVPMLAAIYPDLCGPIMAAGSPLSFWAGLRGENPMRYSGGLLGGSWLTALTSDIGNGKFDGSWLVTNFEGLNPANTLWTKQFNLWSKVDNEAERYLGFEKWWGGHINLNANEIQWIVDNLFIGNKLSAGEIATQDNQLIDFRNIKSPIIIISSKGDNISPPQQGLGWITDIYNSDDEILAYEQTIVYSIHEKIGHLGIFVSGSVAKKEHTEFASNIDMIDCLPPGIYEAVMDEKSDDLDNADLVGGDYYVRFEKRSIDDVRQIVQNKPEDDVRFAAVQRLSEINLGLYQNFMQPWVRMFSNEMTANLLAQFQPSELPYKMFSDNQLMSQLVEQSADMVRSNRRPSSHDNRFVELQQQMSKQIIAALDQYRDKRDEMVEHLFLTIFGSPLLQIMLGLKDPESAPRKQKGVSADKRRYVERTIADLKTNVASGGVGAAVLRALLYIGKDETGADERSLNMVRKIREEHADTSLDEFKKVIREQYFTLLIDEEAAVAAIPEMLDCPSSEKKLALEIIEKVVNAIGKPTGARLQRFNEIKQMFGGTTARKKRAKKASTKK